MGGSVIFVKKRWRGVYHIGTDTFYVELSESPATPAHIHFTEHEVSAIDRAANDRVAFQWSPGPRELTDGSPAFWAMM